MFSYSCPPSSMSSPSSCASWVRKGGVTLLRRTFHISEETGRTLNLCSVRKFRSRRPDL